MSSGETVGDPPELPFIPCVCVLCVGVCVCVFLRRFLQDCFVVCECFWRGRGRGRGGLVIPVGRSWAYCRSVLCAGTPREER